MKNKFKLVETEDYLLAVSDEDNSFFEGITDEHPTVGDWFLHKTDADLSLHKCIGRPATQNVIGDNNVDYFLGNCKKVIGYQPKGNAPELDLPLLPDVEDDVEKLAEEYADFSNDYIPMSFGGKFNETSKRDFIAGYKAATKVYSEEDLRNAMHFGKFGEYEGIQKTQEFIQSLKQPKWFVVECKTEYTEDGLDYQSDELKTTIINNKTYLVGTYLN
jgi:hypothetical protein